MENTLQTAKIEHIAHRPNRDTKKFSIVETFGIETEKMKNPDGTDMLDAAGKPKKKDQLISGFSEPGVLTPKINPHFVFKKDELIEFLKALEARDTTYLVGHSGTGKSELCNQVAARLNYNVVQINFDGHLSRGDLIGDWKITNGNMTFRYGLIPIAFTEPGTIVLFDEIDACPPETAFVLQRAVSSDLKFLMHETNQIIELHPQNAIVGTANTNGMGDDSALYIAGTNIQNFSFLNRWKTVIQVDYISAESETKVLSSMFKEPHVASLIPGVVRTLQSVREAFKGGTISVPLTVRDGINWLEKLSRTRPHPMRAARHSFLDKLPANDAISIAGLIQRNFKLPDTDDKKWITAKR
jgi:cobaltochelatase CobS